MSAAIEAVGFFFGAIGSFMLGVTLFNANWRVSSVDGNVITTSTIYENLWQSCAMDSTGVSNCREFPSLLALSGYLQASRALMITSLVLGLFACILGMIGLQCTKVAEGNTAMKAKLAISSGVLSILGGICAGIAVSWYAFNITKQFFDPLYVGTKYEIGPALYLGWAGALLDVVGGALLCCSYKQLKNQTTNYPFNYRAAPKTASSSKAAPQATLPRYESSNSICKYGKNAYV